MVEFNNADIRAAIRRVIDTDPDLSKKNILRELRQQGFAVGNVRGRTEIDIVRTQRQAGIISEDIAGTLTALLSLEERIRLNPSIRRQAGILAGRAITELLEARPTPTHVRIEWAAQVDAVIYLYGMPIDQVNERFLGAIVQPVDAYNRDFVEARIAQQITGRLTQRYANESETYIEGLEIRFRRIDVSITMLTPRGRASRGG